MGLEVSPTHLPLGHSDKGSNQWSLSQQQTSYYQQIMHSNNEWPQLTVNLLATISKPWLRRRITLFELEVKQQQEPEIKSQGYIKDAK